MSRVDPSTGVSANHTAQAPRTACAPCAQLLAPQSCAGKSHHICDCDPVARKLGTRPGQGARRRGHEETRARMDMLSPGQTATTRRASSTANTGLHSLSYVCSEHRPSAQIPLISAIPVGLASFEKHGSQCSICDRSHRQPLELGPNSTRRTAHLSLTSFARPVQRSTIFGLRYIDAEETYVTGAGGSGRRLCQWAGARASSCLAQCNLFPMPGARSRITTWCTEPEHMQHMTSPS